MTTLTEPVASLDEAIALTSRSSKEPRVATAPSNPKAVQIVQMLLLTLLFAAPALMCIHAGHANDPDLWWHLRTGEWIQQHHAIPHVDSFSRTEIGKPWEAYSWLYELLVLRLFQQFGLVGIVGYTAIMVLAITVALWHLIKRVQADFSLIALLTFGAYFSLIHIFTPRPWLFTILFFVLELDILTHARKTGQTRELPWLFVIFAIWSNTHIQFIYGLAVLGWAAVEALFPNRKQSSRVALQPLWLFATFGGSVLATLANPFGPHIYHVIYNLATQPGGFNKISELQALPFRDLSDFCVLFLALAASGALAWTRRFELFESGILLFAIYASFRSQRDLWVVVIVATAIIAARITGRSATSVRSPRFATPIAIVLALAIGLAGFRLMHVNQQTLGEKIQKTLPVNAVNVVRANGYAGPLFNDFNWGGYLVWSLRMPVSIDGRGAFYGDKGIDRSVATWNAEPDWASDPLLKSAGLVIGPVKSPLTQVLRINQHFQLVYEDKLAAVFVARK